MTILSSLRSRIFLSSALLAVLSIGAAIYLVDARVTREADQALQREILAAGAQIDHIRATRTATFATMARVIADTATLKAAVAASDPATVQEVATGFQHQLRSNLLLITDRAGALLATVGATDRTALIVARQPAIRGALEGHERFSLIPQPGAILQLVTVPIAAGSAGAEILGTLNVGFALDSALAAQLKDMTGSDVAFGVDGQILASTVSHEAEVALAERLRTSGTSSLTLGEAEFVVLPRPLAAGPDEAAEPGAGPVALILRSRTAQLRGLRAIQTELEVTAAVAVALAMLASAAVARTITRPLTAITDAMREASRTGDLTRTIALGAENRWDDEDAARLAAAFNTLTETLRGIHPEIAQKERLSSPHLLPQDHHDHTSRFHPDRRP